MTNCKITVIMPCYQKESRLRACLDSVLQQSITPKEILCVNDGSTDATATILEEYAQNHSEIRVYHQENQGASAARNFAIQQARGEFIAFMDADDEYPSVDCLEYLYTKAMEHGVNIAGGSMTHYADGKIIEESAEIDHPFLFQSDGIMSYADYQYDFGFTRYIYRRAFLLEYSLKFPALKCYEDPVFFVQAMHLSKRFYASQKPSYSYHWESGRALSKASMVDLLKGMLEVMKFSRIHQYGKLRALTLARCYATGMTYQIHQYNIVGDVEIIKCFLDIAKEVEDHPLSKEVEQHVYTNKMLIKSAIRHNFVRSLIFRGSLRDNLRALYLLLRYKHPHR